VPRLATEIPDSYESITRPVAIELARQLSGLLPLPSNIALIFPGSAEEVAMPGSTLNYEGEPNRFASDTRLRIEIDEHPAEDRILATAVTQKENHPVFKEKLGIAIHPIYSSTEISLNCTFRAPNRVSAKKFLDDALIKTAMVREQNVHEVTYHYGIPHAYLWILKYLWQLREDVAGYGDTFDDWVSANISKKATNILTLDGRQQELVIAESQACLIGEFDFVARPEPEQKDNDTGPWVVQFTYKVTYDKVIGCTLQYPLIVHNQLVDETLHGKDVPVGELVDPAKRKRLPSLSRHAFDHFTPKLQAPVCHRALDGVTIPSFDDWMPNVVPPDTSTLFSIMLTSNPDDLHEVLALDELGDWQIDVEILQWMKTEAPWLTRLGQSVIHVGLYREEHPMPDGSITVDANLKVRTVAPMDLRQRYHLRISLLNDLKQLRMSAQDRLRMNGSVCLKILETLQWKLFHEAAKPKLLGGKVVTRKDLLDIATRINDFKIPHHSGVEYRMLTVGNFAVVADRRNNLDRSTADAYRQSETDSTAGSNPGGAAGDTDPLPGCDG